MVVQVAEQNPSYHYVTVSLDKKREPENGRSVALLEMEFLKPRKSLLKTADFLF
jgi:hypothetical protein